MRTLIASLDQVIGRKITNSGIIFEMGPKTYLKNEYVGTVVAACVVWETGDEDPSLSVMTIYQGNPCWWLQSEFSFYIPEPIKQPVTLCDRILISIGCLKKVAR